MKIQCDVCNKDEASVFCSADEAALCAACDHRVHHANKLAGKHQRFSLLHPSLPNQFPLCDICQERKAFVFCQQDRAILCRECDVPIHKANEHTLNHNRFLLTGVKLSATSALYSPSSSSSSSSSVTAANVIDIVPNFDPKSSANNNKPVSVQPGPGVCNAVNIQKGVLDSHGSTTTSSISEYLIEMLPGWQVEDFLDSSPSSFGFYKAADEVMPNWEVDQDISNPGFISSPKDMGIWVPKAPPLIYPSLYPLPNTALGNQISFKESKDLAPNNNKYSRNWREEGVFTVPQIISPPSGTASKRSRTFWCEMDD